MKFKTILLMSLMIGLNLCAYEPLTPSKASEKAYSEYGQVDTGVWCNADYGNDSIPPSFKCYDDKERYKFKEFSLEDFICQSRTTAFRDNYFSDLYNLIVKENPNLNDDIKGKLTKAIEELKSGKVEVVATGDELKAKGSVTNIEGEL